MRRALPLLLLAGGFTSAFGWGPIGHRMVAETAALLVADDQPAGWGPLLARHRFELGVYAFHPDAFFRFADGADGKVEGPTHFLMLDAPGRPVAERGSVDTRIAQFLDRARGKLGPVRSPQGGYLPGATATGDTRLIFEGLYELGVLSHYTGDIAQPYHATADTNGYAVGQGGIHYYFENECVNALEPGLAAEVLARARKSKKAWLAAWSTPPGGPPSWVAAVLADSLAAVDDVNAADRRHAILRLEAAGSQATAARKPPASGCRAMRPLLIDRLARGAVLTAAAWESVLPAGVDFSRASRLQFSDMHAAPEYVAPPPGSSGGSARNARIHVMATSRGPFAKRQKELARREKQKEKQARRLEAKEKAGDASPLPDGEDPDIAGIQLGPQPHPDEESEDETARPED